MTKTKIVKCPICRGKKSIMSLGFSIKQCHECKGIGHVEEVVDELAYLEEKEAEKEEVKIIIDDEPTLQSEVVDIKKRGRKKKVA